MSEHTWEVLYITVMTVNELIKQMIAAGCLLYLCGNYICGGRGVSTKRVRVWTGVTYFCVYVAWFSVPGNGSFSSNFAAMTAAFFVCMLFDKQYVRMKLFLMSTFLIVRWMMLSISNTLSTLLITRTDEWIYRVAEMEENAQLLRTYFFAAFCGCVAFDTLFCAAIFFWYVRMIKKLIGTKERDLEAQELLFLMIPIINGMAVRDIFALYSDTYEKTAGAYVFDVQPAVRYLHIVYYVILLISIVSMIVLNQRIERRREEENARRMLESQMRDMQSHIAEVERLYADIRGVRHDIRNHIEVIGSLLAQGKAKEAYEYAKAFCDTAKALEPAVKTGNPIADVIIREKANQARDIGIDFQVDFHYPQGAGINAFDVSVILSNALSNAIEAAREKGEIRLSSFCNKNAYLITVENSFAGTLDINPASGLPKSAKSDKALHGFGLRNIRAVAAKYHGDLQIVQKDHTVILTVLLQTVC